MQCLSAAWTRRARLTLLAVGVAVLHGYVVVATSQPAPASAPSLTTDMRVQLRWLTDVGSAGARAAPAPESERSTPSKVVKRRIVRQTPEVEATAEAAKRASVAHATTHAAQGAANLEHEALPLRDSTETFHPPDLRHASPDVAAADSSPPPTYATRLPPPRTLRYSVSRADAQGTGEIRWEHDGHRYRAALRAEGPGVPTHDWLSEGRLGEDGVEPTRMLTHRKGRAVAAANFDVDAGTVSFSGPKDVRALSRGAQDRLTWLLQLAAIVDADPARFNAGAHVDLQVIGPRGDAAVWRFEFVGPSRIVLANGSFLQALEVVREGRWTHDVDARLWLDPADHHLPVRWQWQMRGLRQAPVVWERVTSEASATPP